MIPIVFSSMNPFTHRVSPLVGRLYFYGGA